MEKEKIKEMEEKKEVVEVEKVEEKEEAVEVAEPQLIRTREIRKTRDEMDMERIEEGVRNWVPKTKAGKLVKDGKIKDIDEILDGGIKVMEAEIVDSLLKVKPDFLNIGQSKGKFGGGKRRAWRQTQKKTKEGNVPTFACLCVIGDGNGHVGLGYGRAKETLPAREKSVRDAKLNIIKVKRGCASFDCSCQEKHTIVKKITGKSGSITLKLFPAPQGTGLVVGDELKKILKMAGIKDIYGQTFGDSRTTINMANACIDALRKASK